MKKASCACFNALKVTVGKKVGQDLPEQILKPSKNWCADRITSHGGLELEFFMGYGGSLFVMPVSVTFFVTISPQTPLTQRIRMQTVLRAIPRFLRGFRGLYAGIGFPPNLPLVGLENCCPGNGTVGSIPTLSAKPSSLVPPVLESRPADKKPT